MLLLALSFAAGVLSVFAACVLPLLPVIVGGSLSTGGARHRIFTILIALALSIVAFTLLLKSSTLLIGVPEAVWRTVSGTIIALIGVLMCVPTLWTRIPGMSALNRRSTELLGSGYRRGGLWGDIVMGAALGPVFASCSPTYFLILATVLPASFALGVVYLFAYSAGLALALLLVALAGERFVRALGVSLDPHGRFMRGIGVVLIIAGVLIATGFMRQIETWAIERGFDATRLELYFLGARNDAEVQSGAFLSPEMKAAMYERAPELVRPHGYINTGGEPITIGQFRGQKVVLVDIWTYSCINCIRTLPYIKAWWEEYEDDGLVIIGVHTPEFAFEKVQANVEKAAREFGLQYPIVLDNEYETWNAFGNNYWPRKYLIDIDGYIVYDHIGEGAYEQTERAIQRALAERAARLGTTMPESRVAAAGVEAEQATGVGSPEVYFGAWRNELLANGARFTEGTQTFSIPERLLPNALYLGGQWHIAQEYARSGERSARIHFLYRSNNVYMVARADEPVRIRVTRDGGQPLGEARGSDVGQDGIATVQEDRLYRLIEDSAAGVHTIEIEVLDEGLEAYTFTFG